MKAKEIAQLLSANVVVGQHLLDTLSYKNACGADMMSDVLAFVKDQGILLTGLVNLQVINTAEMMDMTCVVFVRGKKPDQKILDLAKSKNMIIMQSDMRMYQACGVLYSHGLGA